MRSHSLLLGGFLIAGMAASGHAARPDDPEAPIQPNRYSSITEGTKSYRPVEPLPWDEINRRVAPAPKQPEGKQAPPGKQGTPERHKH